MSKSIKALIHEYNEQISVISHFLKDYKSRDEPPPDSKTISMLENMKIDLRYSIRLMSRYIN